MATYFIYLTTNLLNGKYYVGKHSTSDMNDNYYGSGSHIKNALRKYGKANFSREILHECENEIDLEFLEVLYVDQSLVDDQMCYNKKLGGNGGWDHINNDPQLRIKSSQAAREYRKDKSLEEILGVSAAIKRRDELKIQANRFDISSISKNNTFSKDKTVYLFKHNLPLETLPISK